jgi:hypothetical protein
MDLNWIVNQGDKNHIESNLRLVNFDRFNQQLFCIKDLFEIDFCSFS